MVLPYSHRISRVLWYSGYSPLNPRFAYGAVTLFGLPFKVIRLQESSFMRVLNPDAYRYAAVWALSLSLATTQKIVFLLSFPPGNKMFQFPGFPSVHYLFMHGYQRIALVSFLIRKSAGQSSFTALRSLSQLVTSFFGA